MYKKKDSFLVLGIESTCDETSAAIVDSGKDILSHVIASQAHIHHEFGGVVPELASRHHSNDILSVLDNLGLGCTCPTNMRGRETDTVKTQCDRCVNTDIYPNRLKNRKFSDAERHGFESEKTGPLSNIGAVFSDSKTGCSAQEKTDSSTCLGIHDIDLIAVAKGPGLIGSLLVGIQTAKALAWSLQKPLVGVNHIEAHLYASMMDLTCDPHHYFPALGMILSGGHSTLLLIKDIGNYSIIGQTVDDALGEAFDKVAKMLHLGYPGGPIVEQYALSGNKKKYPFRAGRVKGQKYSFSFSGLKTAILYTIRDLQEKGVNVEQPDCISDICASFQHAAFTDLTLKLQSACNEFQPKALFLGGGVTQNKTLRSVLQKEIQLPLFWPSNSLCLDNGAMIAGLGFHVWKKNHINECFTLEACTRIEI